MCSISAFVPSLVAPRRAVLRQIASRATTRMSTLAKEYPAKVHGLPQTVYPYFCFNDTRKVRDFFVEHFDFENVMSLTGDDGTIMHCEIKRGNETLFLGTSSKPSMYAQLVLYMKDIQATYEALKEAGVDVTKPEDKFYGDKSASFKLENLNVFISQRVKEMTEEECQRAMDEMYMPAKSAEPEAKAAKLDDDEK